MVLSTGLLLNGCYNLSRLESIGDTPPLTPIKDPTKTADYHPVTMPMPSPGRADQETRQTNSLWRTGARGFFKDQRAKRVGDILTVNVNISGEKLEMTTSTDRERKSQETMKAPKLMGYEKYAPKVLPLGFDLDNLLEAQGNPKYAGSGQTKREDTVLVNIAATITQILPNGNLVIKGRQEVRGNFELREILLTGIVRPEAISSANTVDAKNIAELRLSYGGRGQVTDPAQVPYGQEIIDTIAPF